MSLRMVIATADAMRREKSTSTPSVIREVRLAKSTISMESFDSNAEYAGRLSAISFPRPTDYLRTNTHIIGDTFMEDCKEYKPDNPRLKYWNRKMVNVVQTICRADVYGIILTQCKR